MKHLLLILALFLACSFKGADTFVQGGISFDVPQGWKITEREELPDGGYYAACEKAGEESSGIVAVNLQNNVVPLDEVVKGYAGSLEENDVYKKGNISFGQPVKTKYNNYDCVRMAYTLTLAGIPHQGHLICFHLCDKTITLMEQEATEDAEANKAGFKVIEESFGCK